MNVKDAAKRAGVSVRTLRYYEEIGLIRPNREENGYREYCEADIDRIHMIRTYRELQFSLEEVKKLLDMPRAERTAILEMQIAKLEEKRQIIDNRIALARALQMLGPQRLAELDFSQVDARMAQSRKFLEENEDMRRLSTRLKKISDETGERIAQELTENLARVANAPADGISSAIEKLRKFLENHFGECTDTMLIAYARAYSGDGILAQALEDIAGSDAGDRLRQRITPK